MNSTSEIQVLTGWLAKQADVHLDGTILTSPSYIVQGWLDAVVPGSVLATLFRNGKVKDPYVGDYSKHIDDISQGGSYTYWFYNAFDLPAIQPGKRVELRFEGINDGADIYLNGHRLDSKITGMFTRRSLDVTTLVHVAKNKLAVLVSPPNPPGVPDPSDKVNGGKSEYPNIGESVVARYPVGWDWVIPMPDRSAGLWDRVTIRMTGPVVLEAPHVVTDVPGIRVPRGPQTPANITIRTPIRNFSASELKGTLEFIIDGVKNSAPIVVPPNGTSEEPFIHQLNHTINDPRLWWPNGLGSPELYKLEVSFNIAGIISDHTAMRFGVRQIDVESQNIDGKEVRVFCVNGQRIFLRGGNWIGTDAMFRFSADEKRYRDEVRMHADANLNILRVWGGGIAERTPFYDACDELGMLVMQDFWISGEYDNSDSGEKWKETFLACACDTIQRLRNHPSLLFWTGGNEQCPPGDVAKPGDVANKLKRAIDELDGTRIYVSRSTDISGTDTANADGPYGIQPPAYFFSHHYANPINPEIGSVGVPVYESMQRFMHTDPLADFPKPKEYDKVNAVWRHHKYIPYFNDDYPKMPDQIAIYTDGAPRNTEEFCHLAQLVNYVQYRALFEGFSARMWTWYAGVFVWKSQNPWPGLRGQLYDWYLEQTGGLFGVRRACEPVHVQLDLSRNEVMVVNTSSAAFEGTATATIYDLSGKATNGGVMHNVSVQPPSVKSLFQLQAVPETPSTVYFVDLSLVNQAEEVVSTNLYWLTTGEDYKLLGTGEDYKLLGTLAPAKVQAAGSIQRAVDRWVLTAALSCPTAQPVAFWIRLQVRTQSARLLPVFYSDNYISLPPGAHRTITVDLAAKDVPDHEEPELWLTGWNVAEMPIPLARNP
jgi:mannosylglycoprotein endo-beta-mannosidase